MNMKELVADAKQRMHASVETVRRELSTMGRGGMRGGWKAKKFKKK